MLHVLGTILEHPSEQEPSLSPPATYLSGITTGRNPTKRVFRPLPIPPIPASPGPATPQLILDDLDTSPFSESFSGVFEDRPELFDSLNAPAKGERSFDVHCVADLKQFAATWNDDEIDEVMILSPKLPSCHRTPAALHKCDLQTSKTATGMSFRPAAMPPFLHNLRLSDFEVVLPATLGSPAIRKNLDPSLLGKSRTVKFRNSKGFSDSHLLFTLKNYSHAFPGPCTEAKVEAWREKCILESLKGVVSGETPAFTEKLYGSFVEEDELYLLLGHYSGGTLAEYITTYKNLGFSQLKLFVAELVSAVTAVHGVGLMHRAVNPETIFIDANGHLVLTHFEYGYLGLESPADDLLRYIPYASGIYQAPELLLAWPHNFAVDYWGMGATLYYLVTLKHPFIRDDEGHHIEMSLETEGRILRDPIILEPSFVKDEALMDLVCKCLERNAAIRTKVKLTTHRYFSGVEWHQVKHQNIRAPFQPGQSTTSREVTTAAQYGNSDSASSTVLQQVNNGLAIKGPSSAFAISTDSYNAQVGGSILVQQQISKAAIITASRHQVIPPIFRSSVHSNDLDVGADRSQRPTSNDSPALNTTDHSASFPPRSESQEVSLQSSSFPRARGLRKSKSVGLEISRCQSSLSLSGLVDSGWRLQSQQRSDEPKAHAISLPPGNPQVQPKLPSGVEQIGQGIGFLRNHATRHKRSVCTGSTLGRRSPMCLLSSGFGLGVRGVKNRFSFSRLRAESVTSLVSEDLTDHELEYTEDLFGASTASLGLAMRFPPDEHVQPGVVQSVSTLDHAGFHSSLAAFENVSTVAPALNQTYGGALTKDPDMVSLACHRSNSHGTPTLRLVTSA